MYNVDFHTIAQRVIPKVIRKAPLTEWIKALIRPMQTVNGWFDSYRSGVEYRLQFSGAQIYLEHYLNDLFDPNGRNIYIDNPPPLDRQPIFTKASGQPPRQIIYRKYDSTANYMFDYRVASGTKVYRSIQNNNQGNDPASSPAYWEDEGERLAWFTKAAMAVKDDFIVYVPDNITYDANRLKAAINRYKPAGKNYIIITYTP